MTNTDLIEILRAHTDKLNIKILFDADGDYFLHTFLTSNAAIGIYVFPSNEDDAIRVIRIKRKTAIDEIPHSSDIEGVTLHMGDPDFFDKLDVTLVRMHNASTLHQMGVRT